MLLKPSTRQKSQLLKLAQRSEQAYHTQTSLCNPTLHFYHIHKANSKQIQFTHTPAHTEEADVLRQTHADMK